MAGQLSVAWLGCFLKRKVAAFFFRCRCTTAEDEGAGEGEDDDDDDDDEVDASVDCASVATAPAFVVPIMCPFADHSFTIAAKSISWRFGILKVLNTKESKVVSCRSVRPLVFVRLIRLPACSPQHDCHMNAIM